MASCGRTVGLLGPAEAPAAEGAEAPVASACFSPCSFACSAACSGFGFGSALLLPPQRLDMSKMRETRLYASDRFCRSVWFVDGIGTGLMSLA